MYGVPHKTTIYLPDDLREALRREAGLQGLSEAEVIRRALADSVLRPRPRPGLVEEEPIAERAEALLSGFGER